jgi:Predicted nucleotidyltransferases
VQEVPGSNPGGPTSGFKHLPISPHPEFSRRPFRRQSPSFACPSLPGWLVMMAMSCVFSDSAPQGEKTGATRGEMRPDSDIDFLVDFLPEARPGLLGVAALIRELSTLPGRRVDVANRR